MENNSLLIKNIGVLATPLGREAKKGEEQGKISLTKNAWVLIEDGIISAVGEGEAPRKDSIEVIDAGGCLVTPGLVDAHTHLVFGGWRQHELALKLEGASYLDILAAGGGILSTVRATTGLSVEALAAKAKLALDEMLSFGTTTCEAKSGYGLCLEEEMKQLKAIKLLDETHPIDLVPTLMGAHALPQQYKDSREEFVRLVCEEMIPTAAKEGLAKYCDVFCETGAFTVEASDKILTAAKAHGLIPKIHADEIDPIGGSQLAGKVGAISAEHLIVCPPEGIESMAKGGTVACLLPCTSLYLGATFAPAKDMIAAGVPVAMATDFNPGSCPSLNMQLVINLGCLKYRLTPAQTLTAVTLNGAAAIGLEESVGSVEVGKKGDLVIWNAPDLEYICYRMGSDLAQCVIKSGRVCVDKSKEN